MRRALIAVLTLLGIVLAGVAAVMMTVPGAALAAPVHKPKPPSQIVDGLYKSIVYQLPGNVTLVCILTRLPETFPGFTIPPEYTCARPPVFPTPDGRLPVAQRIMHP